LALDGDGRFFYFFRYGQLDLDWDGFYTPSNSNWFHLQVDVYQKKKYALTIKDLIRWCLISLDSRARIIDLSSHSISVNDQKFIDQASEMPRFVLLLDKKNM
jgi:hypothetical protein